MMKWGIQALLFSLVILPAQTIQAHPGKRDKDGCHVCRTNCEKRGVRPGVRHCHRPDGSIYYPGDEAAQPAPSDTPTLNPQNSGAVGKHGKRGPLEGAEYKVTDPRSEKPLKAYVEKVSDGDTIKVRLLPGGSEKLTVRLLGIDCPESHRNAKCKRDAKAGRKGCDWQVPRGLKASRRAAALLKHKKVYLECGTQGHGKNRRKKCKNGAYGRALRYVRMENNLDYGLIMVREGLCEDFGFKYPHPRGEAYLKAQEQAKRAGRGIWGK